MVILGVTLVHFDWSSLKERPEENQDDVERAFHWYVMAGHEENNVSCALCVPLSVQ